jgi:hypothetical protein
MAETELTQERIAENQATFRDANERIESTADQMNLAGRVPFTCDWRKDFRATRWSTRSTSRAKSQNNATTILCHEPRQSSTQNSAAARHLFAVRAQATSFVPQRRRRAKKTDYRAGPVRGISHLADAQ